MEWFLIYLMVMCEAIASLFAMGKVLFVIGCLGTVAILFVAALTAIDYEFDDVWQNNAVSKIRKVLMCFIVFGAIGFCIAKLIPSQKDLAIIVGAGVTYQAVTSETGKRIGGKAVDLLEKKIDEALKAPEKTEESKKIEGKAL